MRNRTGIYRCSICNSVSNPEIETELGDYNSKLTFFEDPSNPMFDICSECAGEISVTEWELGEEDD